ncbi:MAG: hypothetical protein AAF488_09030, partial [Planctomycetota bacterium]
LEGFRRIVPCGIADAGVTRLADELAPAGMPLWDELCRAVHESLEQTLDRPLERRFGSEATLG